MADDVSERIDTIPDSQLGFIIYSSSGFIYCTRSASLLWASFCVVGASVFVCFWVVFDVCPWVILMVLDLETWRLYTESV